MANNIVLIKRTSVPGRRPNITDPANTQYIRPGQMAINMADQKVFTTDGIVVFEIGANLASLDVYGAVNMDTTLDVQGNTHFYANVTVDQVLSIAQIKAGTSLGLAGQLLQSNGTHTIWDDIPSGNFIYVDKAGSDTNPGTINRPFLTIEAAIAAANSLGGDTVYVHPGSYTINNPVQLPPLTSLIGLGSRAVTIYAANNTADIIWVNNASYISGMTFKDFLGTAIAFPATGGLNITRSPYIFNCASLTSTGTSVVIDGSLASGFRSMVVGLFTMVNQDGTGVVAKNQGYTQLVNIYTICCNTGIKAETGGLVTLNASDTTFGNYGLVADGTSPVLYTGNTSGTDQIGTSITVTNLPHAPYISNAVKFDGDTNYYTVISTSPMVSNTCTFTIQESPAVPIANNTSVSFYQRSQITASAHTFEYVGTGTNIANSNPFTGGINNSNNQAIQYNGGLVNYTSTDQFGNFNINSNLVINGQTATITGDTFQRSLFGLMTPYILALEGQ